jgi:putative ABC transport system permease protein
MNIDGRPMEIPGKEEPVRVESFIVDDHFLDTYNIKLVAGRGISEQMASDTSAFLINQTAVKRFGWSSAKEALGKPVVWSGYEKGRIVGVVRDFNMASLHQAIEPMAMQLMPREQWWKTFISVKIRKSADLPGMLKFLESTWKKYTPRGAYDYFFINQSLEQLHRADFRLAKIFRYVSVLAIFIACLGLLGLVSFMASQRGREVAIRKVLGASIAQILMLFNKEFLGLVFTGFLVAVPCTMYLMRFWLNDFAYRIDIGSGIIILAGLIAMSIAALTVSGQSLRAARVNPVDSLRNE